VRNGPRIERIGPTGTNTFLIVICVDPYYPSNPWPISTRLALARQLRGGFAVCLALPVCLIGERHAGNRAEIAHPGVERRQRPVALFGQRLYGFCCSLLAHHCCRDRDDYALGIHEMIPRYAVGRQLLHDCAIAEGEALVAKITSAATGLSYLTYLGGNHGDSGEAIAVDSAGDAFVAGDTGSTDLTMVNAYQAACGDTNCTSGDAFLFKLNPSASGILYSTYLGGSGEDDLMDLALDSQGAAYVTGMASLGFPTSPDASRRS